MITKSSLFKKSKSLKNFFSNPSGGWAYHKKAWAYKNSLWRPFQEALSQELTQWINTQKANTKAKTEDPPHLVIVGPSGGYNLKTNWLKGFKKITLFDIDPLAEFFFKKNHPGLNIEFVCEDYFSSLSHKPNVNPASANDTPVLFSNVLGQIPLHKKKTQKPIQLPTNYFSYHDYYSVSGLRPKDSQAIQEDLTKKILEGEKLSPKIFLEALEKHSPKNQTVTDHETHLIFGKSDPKAYLLWPLTPHNLHLVEVRTAWAATSK